MQPKVPPTSRTTRAEQRAATQAALLDATIESLLELGYHGTTTRDVAERAGVSQGAQQHYFPTKAELVLAAFTRWFEKTATSGLATGPVGDSERDRLENLLDQFWEIHRPVVVPTLDFLGAERNNPDVASGIAASFNTLAHLAHAVTAAAVPETARIADFDQWLNTVFATIRGAVAFTDVVGIEPVLIDWPALRGQLLRSLDVSVAQAVSAIPHA